jgi:putative FmdB family regulatory protein
MFPAQFRLEDDDMPLYDFLCARCSKRFEELIRSDSATPDCPVCAKHDEVARVPFAPVTVGKKSDIWPPPDIKSARRRR